MGAIQAKVVSALIDDQSSTNDSIGANHFRFVSAVIEVACVTRVVVKQGKQVTSVASSVRVQLWRAPVLEPMTFASKIKMRACSRTIHSIPRFFSDLEGVLELIGRKVVNPSPDIYGRIKTWDTEVRKPHHTVGPMFRVCRIGR